MNIGLSSLPEIRRPLSRTADLQDLTSHLWTRFLRFAKTRSFPILVYAVILAIAFGVVALNVNTVQVTDESGSKQVLTFQSDPLAILRQNNIEVSKNDRYAFSGIRDHFGRITFYASFPVSVTADGRTVTVPFAKGSVADVLKKAGIKLGADDKLNLSANKAASKNMHIVLTRVRFETTATQTAIPYGTETVQDSSLAAGTQKILTPGQNGTQTVTYRLRYENGKFVSQEQTGTATTAPVTQTVAVGTGSVRNMLSTKSAKSATGSSASDGTLSYSEVFTGVATAYTQRKGTLTATGRSVAKGLVAVDPNKIPYGSKLYIASPDGSYVYGNAVAADTGGFVTNGSGILADLFFPTQSECSRFGKRTVNIYVLS